MSKKQWFVECADAFTNETVVGGLQELSESTDMVDIFDADDEKHRVFRVPYSFITRLHASRKSFPVKFKVWQRASDNSKAYVWKFHTTRRKSVKEKKAEADLARLRRK
ncbi:hypothetical protein HN858_01350 [Candidatus Falkowbacteria bacterium]|jgi:hypothetical protein|nr:hypothetical protein [Candidatus Falkowbacteria bacterium]MBT5502774.1 hypothetical protein [Candidatus Falkowbacteria bacterium]MBT6573443.1 hypothetical protein [Candidatus Falkowbacteria bacterium]MBT7348300.1 hypothetical protein [Candidatus Falkowbacteria bacterium]MBT7501172.1 hypothetical protein [Candidatus Falkowbacteria bacterium]